MQAYDQSYPANGFDNVLYKTSKKEGHMKNGILKHKIPLEPLHTVHISIGGRVGDIGGKKS